MLNLVPNFITSNQLNSEVASNSFVKCYILKFSIAPFVFWFYVALNPIPSENPKKWVNDDENWLLQRGGYPLVYCVCGLDFINFKSYLKLKT